MKAMVNGAIPITSRLSPSNLPFLTAGVDMGPSDFLAVDQIYSENAMKSWLKDYW